MFKHLLLSSFHFLSDSMTSFLLTSGTLTCNQSFLADLVKFQITSQWEIVWQEFPFPFFHQIHINPTPTQLLFPIKMQHYKISSSL